MKCTVLYITWEDTRLLKKFGGSWTIRGSARPKSERFYHLALAVCAPRVEARSWLGEEEGGDEKLPWALPF